MAIAYSGISVANIINFPLAGLLCVSGVDGGWPLIFYLPGEYNLFYIPLGHSVDFHSSQYGLLITHYMLVTYPG